MHPINNLSGMSGLEIDIAEAIAKYKKNYSQNNLIDKIVKTMFKSLNIDNEIKTVYVDSYCDLFIEYAKNNPNPNGFYGKYLIDEGVKSQWSEEHQRFKQVLALIPNIMTDVLNKSVDALMASLAKTNDIKTSTQIIMKLLDYAYKIEKDSGLVKDRGNEMRSAKKRATAIISEDDLEEMAGHLDDNN
jgi:subtilase family serine protease